MAQAEEEVFSVEGLQALGIRVKGKLICEGAICAEAFGEMEGEVEGQSTFRLNKLLWEKELKLRLRVSVSVVSVVAMEGFE